MTLCWPTMSDVRASAAAGFGLMLIALAGGQLWISCSAAPEATSAFSGADMAESPAPLEVCALGPDAVLTLLDEISSDVLDKLPTPLVVVERAGLRDVGADKALRSPVMQTYSSATSKRNDGAPISLRTPQRHPRRILQKSPFR